MEPQLYATFDNREVRMVSHETRQIVRLEMTQEEAQALRDVLDFVGGHPEESRRGHIEALTGRLNRVTQSGWPHADLSGGVYFLGKGEIENGYFQG